jgi:hypothetical protein
MRSGENKGRRSRLAFLGRWPAASRTRSRTRSRRCR